MSFYQRHIHYVQLPRFGVGGVVVFLLIFILILIYAFVSTEKSSAYWGTYSQGWPLVYIERQLDTADRGMWFLWTGVNHFSTLSMVANIAVAAATAMLLAFLWSLHTARQSWWKFSLSELLCVVFVFSIVLFYCCRPIAERRKEEAIATLLEEMGWFLGYNEPEPPNWIIRPLIDIGVVSKFSFHRVRSLAWEGRNSDELLDNIANHGTSKRMVSHILGETARLVAAMSYCDEIHICDSTLTDWGLESLCVNWDKCRRADFSNSVGFTDKGLSHVVKHWRNLENLGLSGTTVSDHGVVELIHLPRLTALSIAGTERISIDAAIKIVQHCKALKYLEVPAGWSNDEQFPRLMRVAEEHQIDLICTAAVQGR